MIITRQNEWQFHMASEVNDILKPLSAQTGINFFSHVRIYNDGSRTDLTNQPDINLNYYDPKLKLFEQYIPETSCIESSDAIYLGDPENDPTVQMMKAIGNATYVFSYIDQHEFYTDVFNFAMPKDTQNAFEKYMENLPAIKIFQYDFLFKMGKILNVGKQKRIILPAKTVVYEEKGLILGVDKDLDWNDFPREKKILIGNGVALTVNEFFACKELYNGNSPQRIALIMSKSVRYVNKLLLSSQRKLNAKDTYHLVSILHKLIVFTRRCAL